MHALNIMHRDLKPGNILFTKPFDDNIDFLNTLAINDFGLSLQVGKGNYFTEEKCGTLLYSSPEQALGFSYGKVNNLI